MICQNVKHFLQVADESLQPQPSPPPPPADAAVYPLSMTSSSGLLPAIADAQQINGLLTTGSNNPIENAAAAVSLRADVTDGHNGTVDNDFVPNIKEWMVAVRKFISDNQQFLVDHVAISMTFADMALSEKMLTGEEYNKFKSLKDETKKARYILEEVLPQKTYAQFLIAIKAFRKSGSTGPAEYFDGQLKEIKAEILQNRSAETRPK